ncbi:MAG: VWA domain-containing protein [Alphaproteobacteria bacterium]|nr:VWA domain-containing protein [Alphaproteobacteria bacterium]MCB9795922.1 VWA domain-containing protein [Alphaproteobacteria bacterium]
MNRAHVLPLALSLALSACTSYDLGITQGGAQDLGLARDHIASGQIPEHSAITAEGLFSEHDLPLHAEACEALLCPATAVAATEPVDGSGPQLLAQLGFNTNLGEGFQRRPLNTVAVVDISGSMEGEKLELAQAAMLRMVNRLDSADHMALVSFGNSAYVEVDSEPMGGQNRRDMAEAIEGLRTRGSTSVEAGLLEGFDALEAHLGEAGLEHRVIVFTDARPNVDATDPDSFVALAREQAARGVGVTLIGVGQDLGADLAVKMSEVRGGSYHYLADTEDADRVFVDEFDYNVSPVAYDLEVRVRAAPGVAFGEGFAAPLDEASEDVDFGASTLFVSTRSGGMGVSLLVDEGVDLSALAELQLSYELPGGELRQDQASLAFEGGETWVSEAVAADDEGVFKMAVLVDELHALRGAADFCLGALEQEAAQARVAQAGARLAEVAEALGGDEPLLAEVALMDQLGLNITERGLDACHSR